MDLLGKVAVIVVLLIVISSAVLILTKRNTQAQFTSAQAEQFVLNDLKSSNPGANITVINVSNSTLKSGSYNIVLSIVYNSTTPCPTLFIEEYDYPATGLVPSLDNLYTKNCVIHGLSNAPSYVISSPEIAIVKSFNQSPNKNVSQIKDYVNTFGYANTQVSATFYPFLNNTQTHQSQSYYNVWLIKYHANSANYSVYAILDSSGAVAGNYTSP
jgi:hypothetical protein